jgi:hypothetical protein
MSDHRDSIVVVDGGEALKCFWLVCRPLAIAYGRDSSGTFVFDKEILVLDLLLS